MTRHSSLTTGIFHLRALVAFSLFSAGCFLAMLSFAKTSADGHRALSAFAPAATGSWSIVNSANGSAAQTNNVLTRVMCISGSDCWAVGSYNDGVIDHTLTEHWDGTLWAIVASPNSNATQNNSLAGVNCTSTSNCWAVGHYTAGSTDQTLIEHWDGTSWVIITSPNTGATQPNDFSNVTCTSAADCWAVGYFNNGSRWQTLTEHWDGTVWTIVTSANALPTQNNYLDSVTCASASDCWAVGRYLTGVAYQTLIERWNGTAWLIVPSPNNNPSQENVLSGVTCASASNCWAVGSYWNGSANGTLIAQWNGVLWAIVASPNTSATQNNLLYDVTCNSGTDCWSVGSYLVGSAYRTLIERWDGTAWAIVTSPDNGGTGSNVLASVTCVAGSDCWAVGYYVNGANYQTFLQYWGGTSWDIVISSDINTARTNNILYGGTCVSASDCWAVGDYYPYGNTGSTPSQTLITHFDGTAWAVVTSPNTSIIQRNVLSHVTCAPASDCWAVGYYFNGNNRWQTLAEHWDGSAWAVVPSPSTSAAQDNYFYGVACGAVSDCWAVGYSTAGSGYQTLIEHWDGTAWAIATSPNLAAGRNELNDVSCTGASDCWAVGSYNGNPYQTLIEHWDGSSWTIVTSPTSSDTQHNYLTSVTCVSGSDCWAVGRYFPYGDVNTPSQNLLEHWDGTAWAIVPAPNSSETERNVLFNIACASTSECWVVGYYDTGSAVQTLIEQWDGLSWAIVTSPNTNPTQDNGLTGVSCVSAGDCWAFGYYYDYDTHITQTLTQHYTANLPPIPTRVVSRKTHGSIGDFDVDLPLTGSPGIECRSGGATGDHTIVVTFPVPVNVTGNGTVKARVTSGSGQVGSGGIADGNAVTVSGAVVTISLTNVTDAQRLSVTIFGVNDGTNTGDVAVPMGVLLGDVNASGNVDAADVGQVQRQNNQAVTTSNYLEDVNISGNIDAADVGQVQRQNSKHLP